MRIGLASTLDWIATFECSFMLKKFAGSIFNESITWYPMHAEEIKAKPERERKKNGDQYFRIHGGERGGVWRDETSLETCDNTLNFIGHLCVLNGPFGVLSNASASAAVCPCNIG